MNRPLDNPPETDERAIDQSLAHWEIGRAHV